MSVSKTPLESEIALKCYASLAKARYKNPRGDRGFYFNDDYNDDEQSGFDHAGVFLTGDLHAAFDIDPGEQDDTNHKEDDER